MADAALDPCYHRACDTIENINQNCLGILSGAAAYVLSFTALNPNLRGYLSSSTSTDRQEIAFSF